MKNKIYNILFFAIALLLAQVLSSCKKNNGCTDITNTQNIPINDLTKVPYTDTSKLTFVRTSNNDTFTFKGQGWSTIYQTIYPGGYDCP